MQKIYNTGIINCSEGSNALCIRLTNTSPSSNYVSVTVYDYTDSTPKIAYNTTLYLSPKSIKAVTFPLIVQNYDDYLNIRAYEISYTLPNHFIKLSYKELYINNSYD